MSVRSANSLRLALTASVAAAVVGFHAPAYGQEAPTPANSDEEIVVTAQFREESLTDVPISITAISGEELDSSTLGGVTEALKAVPGVATFGDRNGIGSQITIRGIPTGFLFEGASPIAYYLDSIPMGMVRTAVAPDASAYDLDRVEVLRGPQGTLYGASAEAGVVRVLTNDPNVDEFEFKARGLVSSTRHSDDVNYQGNVAVNVPIVDGKVAARVVVGYKDFAGWIDRPGFAADSNDTRMADLRFKLRIKPVEELTIDGSVWISRMDSNAPPIGLDDYTRPALVLEPSKADYTIYSGRIAYDLGFASITSATNYLDTQIGNTLAYAPFCCGDTLQVTEIDSKIFTQEFLLASKDDTPWRWSAGAFYRDAKDRTIQGFPPFAPGIVTGWIDTSESFAVFGEVTRVFADGQFEITGGLRYFKDKVTIVDIAPPDPANVYADSATFDSISPRLVLTWHPNDDAMVYASFGKGFRSGSTQTPPAGRVGFEAAEPETLFNYEIGAKASLFDNFLDVDIAAYYMNRKGIQQNLSVPVPIVGSGLDFSTAYVNGPGASGLGVDFAFTVHPARGVRAGVNGSINDLTFDEDVVTGPNSDILAPKGGRINLSPKTTLGAFVDATIPIGRGVDAILGASVNHRSSVLFNRVGALPVKSDSITIARASVGVRLPQNWEITAFVDNLTNENGVVVADTFTPVWDLRTRPRTFGLQLEYKY